MTSSACATRVLASRDSAIFMLGTRDVAAPLRSQVQDAIDANQTPVCVDFQGRLASQSFMDEFLGMLILRNGPAILERIIFQNCHDDVKATINLVATIRSKDYAESVIRRAQTPSAGEVQVALGQCPLHGYFVTGQVFWHASAALAQA
jgi:hypothetical protein